tara:strand:- start:170 stop:931 length:762 start_codon:yes stop_codon:yes gene_type:complete
MSKRIIRRINNNKLKANSGYQDDISGNFYITDSKGKFLRFASEQEAINQNIKNEKDSIFKKAVKKEETKTIENKAKRNKEVEKYKSSSELQREKYDSAMDEYFKIDGKLQKQIDAIKGDSFEEVDVADIISGSPQLKNLQKNKIKAMKKVWALSQSGDEDYRDESLDAFGSLPDKDYGKFTPSASPGVREYASREQKIDTSMAKDLETRKNMDVQEGSFSTQPRTREEVSESIPKIPKKKYTDEELLRIIAGK